MRILIDQSGYDLLNLGDVAMLQSCVRRLWEQWPEAEISVLAHAPERLADYCPGTDAVGRTFADRKLVRALPRKVRLGSEQAWKVIGPYLAVRAPGPGRAGGAVATTAVRAVQSADLVVASGGGYLTDTWWWHGAGVLSLLGLAQRLGKPTAMFGQGVGPIRRRGLRAQARAVLPGLAVLGLREDVLGRDLALSLGAEPSALTLTGDDALALLPGAPAGDGDALGVNIRVAGYAGVDAGAAAALGAVLGDMAGALRAPLLALPVSRYPSGADLAAIDAMLTRAPGAGAARADLVSPEALIAAAGRCRTVVTGSYHAAVFAVAQGVPAVCLTRSAYYDAKFAGLSAQFPRLCQIVALAEPDAAPRLRAAVDRAWQTPPADRAGARADAARLAEAGRAAYRRLRAVVGASPAEAGLVTGG